MKKFKLISTIASLCLAVALMAFGVYAAKTINVSVTSNITFSTGANVKGTLTVKSYNIKDYTVNAESPTAPTIGDSEKVWEEFTASVNNAAGSAALKTGDGTNSKVELTSDKLYVVYAISFESSFDNKPTLKVDTTGTNALSITTGSDTSETAVGDTNAKLVYNGLSSAVNSYDTNSSKVNTYYIVIQIQETAVNKSFDYKVKFNVTIDAVETKNNV